MSPPPASLASSSAPGTRVVLPAPGGATSTAAPRSRTAATSEVITSSMGRGASGTAAHLTSTLAEPRSQTLPARRRYAAPMPSPFPAPPMPDLAPERVATATFPLRYEDIAQDGRMMATALPPAVGWTVWSQLLADHPAAEAMEQRGLVAILSRLTV